MNRRAKIRMGLSALLESPLWYRWTPAHRLEIVNELLEYL